MRKKKYVIKPGKVISKTDGDVHHVSANDLAQLYGVDMSECVVSLYNESPELWPELNNLIVLTPRNDGNYTLPEK